MEKDKVFHTGISALITMVGIWILAAMGFGYLSIIMASEVALIIGLGKELYDSKMGGVNDPLDVKADIMGIIIGAIIGSGGLLL